MSDWKKSPVGSCITCKWWLSEEGTDRGECHRHAPGPAPYLTTKMTDTQWPNTADNDYCGEYEADAHMMGKIIADMQDQLTAQTAEDPQKT